MPLNSPEAERLVKLLGPYNQRAVVASVAGMLTAPEFHANTVRLEILVQLAVAHCNGRERPALSQLQRWVNVHLAFVSHLEDPVEDVFVSNVMTPAGNHAVFEGIWEYNDFYLQTTYDVLAGPNVPAQARALLEPCEALLSLGSAVAYRLGLLRWHSAPSTAKENLAVAPNTRVPERANAVSFSNADLAGMGLTRAILAPFIFDNETRATLATQATGESNLDCHPLLDFGDTLVLALPTSVSAAIRLFLCSGLRDVGYLPAFYKALCKHQATQLERDLLVEFRGNAKPIQPAPFDQPCKLDFHAWAMLYDQSRYVHIVLLHDRFFDIPEAGLLSSVALSEEQTSALAIYLSRVALDFASRPGYSGGITLIVRGGIGRTLAFAFDDFPESWDSSVVSLPDILLLTREGGRPLEQYFKFLHQRKWSETQGVEFFDVNGDLNSYAFWRWAKFQLVPRDLPLRAGAMVAIQTDFIFSFRRDHRNAADIHAVQRPDGSWNVTLRHGRDSYFEYMTSQPIYVGIDSLASGVLSAAFETSRGPTWLTVFSNAGSRVERSVLFEIWSGLLGLVYEAISVVESAPGALLHGPVEVRLDFSNVEEGSAREHSDDTPTLDDLQIDYAESTRVATIPLPAKLYSLFQRPENSGERYLLAAVIEALATLYGIAHPASSAARTTETVLGNSGIRLLHVFQTHFPHDILLERTDVTPIFIDHADYVFAKLGLSYGCTTSNIPGNLASKVECSAFLHSVVEKLWRRIQSQLALINRPDAIAVLLDLVEAINADSNRWRRTSLALQSIHGDKSDVPRIAMGRESDRTRVSLAARTLVEMAVCNCSATGGAPLIRDTLDRLLATTTLMLEAATDSDAIFNDLISPSIILHANGEYLVDKTFQNEVVSRFFSGQFDEKFARAVGQYAGLYEVHKPGEVVKARNIYAASFVSAFKIEFGVEPDDVIDCMAALIDFAVERDALVVRTTVATLKNLLLSSKEVSSETAGKLIQLFALVPRLDWATPPDGFSRRDINPWRYGRRLSAVVRPLVIVDDSNDPVLLFGCSGVMKGLAYLIERAERGHFSQDFFKSREMRAYIGGINNERGGLFTRRVAAELLKHGWQVRTEVLMSSLGAPARLGDIDVLAWREDGRVLLIECKRLQFARTVAEIAETCKKFRGDANDLLRKHIQRVEWVQCHLSALSMHAGFVPQIDKLTDWLVTNTIVPFSYIDDLPMPSNRIGTLASLLGIANDFADGEDG